MSNVLKLKFLFITGFILIGSILLFHNLLVEGHVCDQIKHGLFSLLYLNNNLLLKLLFS